MRMHSHRVAGAQTWIAVVLCLIGGLIVVSCSEAPRKQSVTALPARLDDYFELYCDYTGGLGIGFVASHTYDYRFRQFLKTTQDPELKRLYVLQYLHQEVDGNISLLADGKKIVGKQKYSPLTRAEWQDARRTILQQIEDLAAYTAFTNFAPNTRLMLDSTPMDAERGWIEELRQRVYVITNSPSEAQNYVPDREPIRQPK